MSLDRRTIAAVRFGYGFNPARPGPENAADLFAAVEAGAGAPLLFEHRPLAVRTGFLLKVMDMGRRIREAREGGRKRGGGRSDSMSGGSMEMNSMTGSMGDSAGGSTGDSRGADDPPRVRQLKARRKEVAVEARRVERQDVPDLLRQRALGYGFFERLTAFWADHFTIAHQATVINRLGVTAPPSFEQDVIRPHVAGRFGDMLRAVVQSPVMIAYLQQQTSFGPKSARGLEGKKGLNENLAREILELHTLGVSGGYAQADVRAFANLLTGLAFDRSTGKHVFRVDMGQPGRFRILGKVYGGPRPREHHIYEFLDDLSRHPGVAAHLARKLAVHFVSNTPPEALVDHIAQAWLATDGDLMRVCEALLEHPAAWSGPLEKVKRPVDYLVALIRAANLDPAEFSHVEVDRVNSFLRRSNQFLWNAPGPDGWPEANEYWISAPGMVGRLKLADRFGGKLEKNRDIDPRRFAEEVLGSSLRPDTAFAVKAAETRREGFAFVFASPEFNRR